MTMSENQVCRLWDKGFDAYAISYILDWDIGRVRSVLTGHSDPGGPSALGSAIGAKVRGSGDKRVLKCSVCGHVKPFCDC